ncbi:unnamed protein product, partial [Gulo gulo]
READNPSRSLGTSRWHARRPGRTRSWPHTLAHTCRAGPRQQPPFSGRIEGSKALAVPFAMTATDLGTFCMHRLPEAAPRRT